MTPDTDVSLLALVNVVLRRRRVVALVAATAAAVTIVVTLARGRTWSTESAFTPQVKSPAAGLSTLAAQFGVAVPSPEANQSPAFYADLVRSRGILGPLADAPLTIGGRQVSLAEAYEVRGRTPELRRDAVIRRLDRAITVAANQRTGVVEVTVRGPRPEVALRVHERLLELLNQFNLETRQSQATAERQFTERRLADVRRELRASEDRLQQFLQRNRDFRNSPELAFQQERLARDVALHQTLYVSLSQAFEQARIDEVRDTPVITVLQRPERPVRPDPRGLVGRTLVALVAGLGIGIALAFALEAVRSTRADRSSDAAEFRAHLEALRRDLMRWRRLRAAAPAGRDGDDG